MRIFGTANIRGLMERLGMEEGVPIEHKMVTKAIARAQSQVEAQNFEIRKHLLEYDDVMNKQRENVYTLRRQLLESKIKLEDEPEPVDTQGYLLTVAEDVVANTVDEYCPPNGDREDWDVAGLKDRVEDVFGLDGSLLEEVDEPGLRNEAIADTVWTSVTEAYHAKEEMVGKELFRVPDDVRPQLVPEERLAEIMTAPNDQQLALAGRAILEPISRSIMLQIVDQQWKDHLYSLDHLKEGIGLRGYGQRDPLVEYKKESFTLFQAMKGRIDEEMVRYLWRLRPVIETGDGGVPVAPVAPRRPPAPRPSQLTFSDTKQPPPPPRRPLPRWGLPPARRRPRRAAPGPRRRRRRAGQAGPARRAQGRPQRSLPVRQRQEVQEVPRGQPVMPAPVTPRVHSKADAVCRPLLHAEPSCPHLLKA